VLGLVALGACSHAEVGLEAAPLRTVRVDSALGVEADPGRPEAGPV